MPIKYLYSSMAMDNFSLKYLKMCFFPARNIHCRDVPASHAFYNRRYNFFVLFRDDL